jgi:hypothetical protein
MIQYAKSGNDFMAPLKAAGEYDAIVIGSGPSGCIAAISAARNGAKTLLIEREGYLGGMMTGGSINGIGINGYIFRDSAAFDGGPRPYVVEGIALEVYKRLQVAGGALPGKPQTRGPIDSMILIHVLDEMMEEAGVTVLFNTIAFDAVVQDNVIKGIAVSNKSGGQIYYAKTIIDCSADGDVAYAAGCEYEHGRPEDKRSHGGSLDVQFGGIDVDKFLDFMQNQPILDGAEREKFEKERKELIGAGGEPNMVRDEDGKPVARPYRGGAGPDWKKIAEDVKKGVIPHVPISPLIGGGPLPGVAAVDKDGKYIPMQLEVYRRWVEYIKAGKVPKLYGAVQDVYPPPRFGSFSIFRHGKFRLGQMQAGVYESWFDQTNEIEISKALIAMRKINLAYLNFLRECIPGCEEVYIINEAPMVGTRESRRILGEYYVTIKDIMCGARFDDVIGLGGPRGADAHSITGRWGDGVVTVADGLPFKEPYDIPYRCLVPKKIDNLLLGGRCVSGNHLALGAMRDMATCMVTGEAAGAAAALCAKTGKNPRQLNVKELQDTLRKQGVKLAVDPSEMK